MPTAPRSERPDDGAALAERLGDFTRWRSVTHLAAALLEDGGARVTFAGRDADERSDFEIGSVTKGLTGLLLADAVERGEVSLATRLGELLELGDSPAAAIALGALATHTSGLPGLPRSLAWRGSWDYLQGRNPYREVGPDAVVDALRTSRVGRPVPRYSNFGFSALGLALATASGTTYPELLKARILDPLRMTDTYVPAAPAALREGALPGHSARGKPTQAWTMTGIAPAGGVRSTTRDMARLAAALLDGSAPGLAALEARADFQRGTRIGLAWLTSTDAAGRELVWHNGMTGGFSSILVLDRTAGRGAVVLNASSRVVDDVGRGLLDPTPGTP